MGRPYRVDVAIGALALLAAAVTVNRAVFSASISDASGYIAAAEGLRTSQLSRPVPLQLIPAVRDSGANTSPLGFRAGQEPGTEVPTYPLGYPMLMAAAEHLSGSELSMYVVAPLAFAALIFAAYLLASDLAGIAAGAIAAVLVAGNPIAILGAVFPMSDVPATACWLLACHFAYRASAVGGG